MTPLQGDFAFFDVDETLIRTKSMFDFFRFLCERTGALGRLRDFDQEFTEMRSRGLPREDLNRAYYRHFAGMAPTELRVLGAQWWQAAGQRPDILIAPAVSFLKQIRAAGTSPVFVSGSFEAVLEPIGRQLGVSTILCTTMLIGPDGTYSGEIGTPQTIGQGKADAIGHFLLARSAAAQTCWAVGDDLSDLPMLAAVGHPVAVGRGTPLAEVANREGWPVLAEGPVPA